MLKEDRKFSGKDVLIGAFTGVPNTFILYFSLNAVEHLPAYIVFPAYSARSDIGSQCSKLFFVQGKSFKTGEDIYRHGSGSSYFDQYMINTGRRLPLQTGGSHL